MMGKSVEDPKTIDQTLVKLAKKYDTTVYTLILRFLLQKGLAVVADAENAESAKTDNYKNVLCLRKLDDEDFETLVKLNKETNEGLSNA